MRRFMTLNNALIVGSIVALGLVINITKPSGSEIVVIDMKKAINQPVAMLTKTNMPEKTKQTIIKKYSSLLPRVIRAYGHKNNLTVISTPVLASGNKADITNIIIEQTLNEVKRHA